MSLAFITALGSSVVCAADEADANLAAQAKITQEEAVKTALAKVPNGKVQATELEEEHGKLIWSCDIAAPGSKNITEVQVDAKTGAVISVQVETSEEEAKEDEADKTEKKK